MQFKSAKLIYFSPTGTTRTVVEHIAKGIGLAANVVDLTSPEVRTDCTCTVEEDLAIIGVPVYAQRIPHFLRDCFINILGNGKPTVIVCVYGNVDAGIALNELYDLCTDCDFNVIAAALFIGQHSFSNKELKVAPGRPDLQDRSIARDFGLQFRYKLTAGGNRENLSVSLPKGRLSVVAKLAPPHGERLVTRQPLADDSCKACGICAGVCPVGAISPENFTVKEELCLRCFSCVRQCPEQSRQISFKKGLLIKNYLRINASKRKEPLLFL